MSSAFNRFRLPSDGETYTNSVFERCRDLITYKIWDGIEPYRLDSWIRNFRTKEERYLAAKILDALIYRSKEQTIALAKQLFQRVLPDLQRSTHIAQALGSVYDGLKGIADPNVRLVPVTVPGRPVQSGPSVGRILQRGLRFSKEWFVDCSAVTDRLTDGHAVIFIDDFLGTGTQFVEFVCSTGLHAAIETGKCVYVPLVAHKDGIEHLKTVYSYKLPIAAVEVLDESHALFHEEAGSFPDGENTAEVARNFYYWLLADRGIGLSGEDRRGFGCFELAYAFDHGVPDNSLPLLWWAGSASWQPLFDR